MIKKAQGLSMNTIVIAALALLVLSIISLLFIGRMNVARDDLGDCAGNGGVCVDSFEYRSCEEAVQHHPDHSRHSTARELTSYSCPNPDHLCCIFS